MRTQGTAVKDKECQRHSQTETLGIEKLGKQISKGAFTRVESHRAGGSRFVTLVVQDSMWPHRARLPLCGIGKVDCELW